MSLKDRLASLRNDPFTAWLESLDAEDRAALYECAKDENLTGHSIWRQVKEEGCPLGKDKFGVWVSSVRAG